MLFLHNTFYHYTKKRTKFKNWLKLKTCTMIFSLSFTFTIQTLIIIQNNVQRELKSECSRERECNQSEKKELVVMMVWWDDGGPIEVYREYS